VWNTQELSNMMMDYALARSADAQRIVNVVRDHGAWNPPVISYFLDGGLPTEGSEATVLGNLLISDLMENADTKAQSAIKFLNNVTPQRLEREKEWQRMGLRRAVTVLHDYQRNNDVEALRLHMKYSPSSIGNGTSSRRLPLQSLISDLRSIGHKDIESFINEGMIQRVSEMTDALMFDGDMFQSDPSSTVDIEKALRIATAVGSPTVKDYINASYSRTLEMAFIFKTTDHKKLLDLIEERAKHHEALGTGVL
jgi:hypothetical protein